MKLASILIRLSGLLNLMLQIELILVKVVLLLLSLLLIYFLMILIITSKKLIKIINITGILANDINSIYVTNNQDLIKNSINFDYLRILMCLFEFYKHYLVLLL